MTPISAPAPVSPTPLGAPSPQGPGVRIGASSGYYSKLLAQATAQPLGPTGPVCLWPPLPLAGERHPTDHQGLWTGHPPLAAFPSDFPGSLNLLPVPQGPPWDCHPEP